MVDLLEDLLAVRLLEVLRFEGLDVRRVRLAAAFAAAFLFRVRAAFRAAALRFAFDVAIALIDL